MRALQTAALPSISVSSCTADWRYLSFCSLLAPTPTQWVRHENCHCVKLQPHHVQQSQAWHLLHRTTLTTVHLSIAEAEGNTPLHKAARTRTPPELVRALVLAGARLDCANRMGLTPLQLPCKQPEFTSHVLSAVEEQGVLLTELGLLNLDTPLHRAVACNQPGLLRALLTEGASPEVAATGTQATPLVLAAQLGHDACERELLAASADPG